MGTTLDVHTMHWHANTHLINGRRGDVLQMLPGSQYSVYMETRATSVGIWLIHCHIDDHIPAGMVALYKIKGVLPPTNFLQPSATGGKVREYWVGAVLELWDYVGGNADPVNKNNCPASAGAADPAQWDWTKYWKVLYVEFESPINSPGGVPYSVRKVHPAYLGLNGPVFRAHVGDTIRIHFKNMLPCNDPNDPVDPTFCHPPVSIHPHGMAYLKDSEGAPYADPVYLPNPNDLTVGSKQDDWVYPGVEVVYNWGILPSAGPGPKDASTVTWFYHPHTDETGQPYAGMNGMIIVGRSGAFAGEDADGHLTNVKDMQDFNLIYMIFDEMLSYLWTYNLAYQSQQVPPVVPLITAFYAVNGFIYCNNDPLQLTAGSTVRLHLLSAGTDMDIHTPTLSGSVFTALTTSVLPSGATTPMLSGTMTVADVKINSPVTVNTPEVLTCGTLSHAFWGERFAVTIGPGTIEAMSGKLRRYYIAADKVTWTYGENNVGTGNFLDKCPPVTAPFPDALTPLVPNYGATATYTKARYRLYTDSTFTTVATGESDSHGILGPLISAEGGDVVQITFKNNLLFDVNLRLEGALPVAVATVPSFDPSNPVTPGNIVTYNYLIPKSSGPTSISEQTVSYAYSSTIDAEAHSNAGLIGIASVGFRGHYPSLASGSATPIVDWVPKPYQITSVVPVLPHVFDENMSAFAVDNGLLPGALPEHIKYTINGGLFCNGVGHSVKVGSRTRAIFLSYGGFLDQHSVRISGHTLTTSSRTSAGADLLLPLTTVTADFTPAVVGQFFIEDNQHDHRTMGERVVFTVQGARSAPPPPSARNPTTPPPPASGPPPPGSAPPPPGSATPPPPSQIRLRSPPPPPVRRTPPAV